MTESSAEAIRWEDRTLVLLDQRVLPEAENYQRCQTAEDVAAAIKNMVVRGAPAIGISAAYGVVLAATGLEGQPADRLQPVLDVLAASRPTAVNLFWALDRMKQLTDRTGYIDSAALLREAISVHEEDKAANLAMGEAGAELIAETGKGCVLTHCNTGSLATGGYGTALGVIRSAFRKNLVERVYADETRPWLQGARLTAWELQRDGIPVALIADGAAAHVLKKKSVKWIIVGADRITANGDVANKIGTYSLAVLARYHGVRFMVAAPSSTIDFSLTSGELIPIEERTSEELKQFKGHLVAPKNVDAFNPVFDVTPAELIDAIVTEKGVIQRPDAETMASLR